MNSSTSGWSASRMTIFAARRVVPPDFIAPAALSNTLRKLIIPDEIPPPDRDSDAPRNFEKFVPVPLPYLNIRASWLNNSKIPPSFTKLSLIDWIKQAEVCGREKASGESQRRSVSGET